MDLPLFLGTARMPARVRAEITRATLEAYEADGVPEDDREAAGYCRAYLLWYSWLGRHKVLDVVWDEMYHRLKAYEKQWPQLVTPRSPTQGGSCVDRRR